MYFLFYSLKDIHRACVGAENLQDAKKEDIALDPSAKHPRIRVPVGYKGLLIGLLSAMSQRHKTISRSDANHTQGHSMHVLTVANNKGGVAKTTAVQILAPYSAAVLGLNTLVIDMDEQGNLSLRFIDMVKSNTGDWVPAEHPDTKSIQQDDPEFEGVSDIIDLLESGIMYPYPTQHENLTILPSNGPKIKRVATLRAHEDVQAFLYNFFKRPEVQAVGWDLILIDTPPSLGALTLSAIRAATHVLVPVIPETKCMEGLYSVFTKVNMENRKKPTQDKTEIAGILLTKYQKNQTVHRKYLKELQAHSSYRNHLVDAPMYDRSDIRGMDEKIKEGVNVPTISPFDKTTFKATNRRECEAWCKEVMERVLGKEEVANRLAHQQGELVADE